MRLVFARAALLFLCAPVQAKDFSFSSALASVAQEFHQVTIPGTSRNAGEASGRRMLVEELLKSVSGVDKLSPEQLQVMQEISEALQLILEDFMLDRNSNQEELDRVIDRVASCVGVGVSQDQALESATTQASGTHSTCRNDEQLLFDTDSDNCGALVGYLSGLDSPHCIMPDPIQAALDTWQSLFDQGYEWFEGTKQTYEPKRNACQASTSALAAKKVLCDQDQVSYEALFCQWRLHRTDRCEVLTTCYDNHVSEHTGVVDRIKPLADRRVNEARMVTYINCVIEQLANDVADLTPCEPLRTASYQNYNQTYPEMPDRTSCSTSEVDVYPGHVDWFQTSYGTFPTNAQPVANSGAWCSA